MTLGVYCQISFPKVFFFFDHVSKLSLFLCSFFPFFMFHGSCQTFSVLRNPISFIPKVWFDAQDGLRHWRLALCLGWGSSCCPGPRLLSLFLHVLLSPCNLSNSCRGRCFFSPHRVHLTFWFWLLSSLISVLSFTAVAKALSLLKQAH